MAAPEISVVVPTRERPGSLARCLAALDRQTVREVLEVVIVDDAGDPAGAVPSALGVPAWRRLLRAPGRGAAAARNAGVAAAEAPLILFTDDDCEPDPGWAETLAGVLRDRDVVAAGQTVAGPEDGRLAIASQHVANYLTRSSLDGDGRIAFAASNNVGCRAEVAAGVPFDEGYPGSGGEDRDWCARLIKGGKELLFVPEALVTHRQPLTPRTFWRKHAGYGRGARIFHPRHGHPDTRPARRFHLRLVRDAFREGADLGTLVCLAQVATAAGFARQAISERRP